MSSENTKAPLPSSPHNNPAFTGGPTSSSQGDKAAGVSSSTDNTYHPQVSLPLPVDPHLRGEQTQRFKVYQRHRWMLWIGFPVAALLVALALMIIGVWGWSAFGARAEHQGHLQQAERHFELQRDVIPWLEPWRTSYNIGTVYAGQKRWEEAEDELKQALEQVPAAYRNSEGKADASSPECSVRNNLSEVLAQQAHKHKEEGRTAQAQQLYSQAGDYLEPCASGKPVDPMEDLTGEEQDYPKDRSEQAKNAKDKYDELMKKAGRGKETSKDTSAPKKKDDPPPPTSPQAPSHGDKPHDKQPPPEDPSEEARQRQLNSKNHRPQGSTRQNQKKDGYSDGRNW